VIWRSCGLKDHFLFAVTSGRIPIVRESGICIETTIIIVELRLLCDYFWGQNQLQREVFFSLSFGGVLLVAYDWVTRCCWSASISASNDNTRLAASSMYFFRAKSLVGSIVDPDKQRNLVERRESWRGVCPSKGEHD